MPCPPTTFAMNNGNCGQYPDSQMGELPGEPDETAGAQTALAQCPEEYWNAETQTCDVPLPECGENEYFDTRKGFCVPLQDDCCELGQDYSAYYKECVDIVTKPRDGECPNGFELIGDLCWLIDRTEGKGGMCWTITRNTPRCVGPCEVGLIYNELTGRCDEPYVPEEPKEPSDPCAGVKCSSYSYKNCPSNCCKLVEVSSGNPVCKKK
jgi:hypothetical protein